MVATVFNMTARNVSLFGIGMAIFFCLLLHLTVLKSLMNTADPDSQNENKNISGPPEPEKSNLLNGVDNIIKKRAGGFDGSKPWTIIDGLTASSSIGDDSFDCEMTLFTSSLNHVESEMCVHESDFVSNAIRRRRRWGDCDILSSLWKESQNINRLDGDDEDERVSVYVEIGANIGSCVMEMLMETDAQIIAFEPHPMNVYNLKRTLSNLERKYQERVRLFPVGLGDQCATNTIYSASRNMGNSVIGTQIKDFGSQVFDEKRSYTVNVERLDTILKSENINIKLLKLDAQGFECRILEGMGAELASKIDILKFEWAKKWLLGQECHDLLPRLRDFGFKIYRQFNHEAKEKPFDNCVAATSPNFGITDLIAVKPTLYEINGTSSEGNSDGILCECGVWKNTDFSCEDRVEYLVKTYGLSKDNATMDVLKDCKCF